MAEPVRCWGCEELQQAERDMPEAMRQECGLSLVLVPNVPDEEGGS